MLLPGVSDVQLSGIRSDEISIELKPLKLLEYDITFDEVATAIRGVNIDVSSGQLKGNRLTVSVRMLGEERRGIDLENIVIRSDPDGREVRLRDLATVSDGFIESDLESYFNGEPAAHCVVYKTPSQDAIQISRLVKAYVKGKLEQVTDNKGEGFVKKADPKTMWVDDMRGTHKDLGYVEMAHDPVREIYAVAESKDVVNTAVFDGNAVTRSLTVYKLTTSGIATATGAATCTSANTGALVMHAGSSCSKVAVKGTETTGAEDAVVAATYTEHGVTKTAAVSFRVWFPYTAKVALVTDAPTEAPTHA